jgi:hypothetical protein
MEGVEMEGPPAKRSKRKKSVPSTSNKDGEVATYSYHPEDDQIQNVRLLSSIMSSGGLCVV